MDGKKILVHALEGMPDNPKNFTGNSERDIRVRWLVTDPEGAPVGTGPWRVKGIDNTGIVLERNTSLPPEKQPKHIDEVHLPFIPGGDVLATRLLLPPDNLNHVDFAPALTDPGSFSLLEANKRIVQILIMPGFNLFYLGFRMDRPFFSDTSHREAVVKAIDVDALVSLGNGAADPAVNPVPLHMHGHDPNLRQGTFDPPGARALLKSKEAVRLTLVYNNSLTYARALAETVATDIENNLSIPSVSVSINRHGFETWGQVAEEARDGQPDMFLYSWNQRVAHSAGHPKPNSKEDPFDFLIPLFHSRNIGTTNLTRYSNPQVDALLDGPLPDHRKALRLILDDAPMVSLSYWTRRAAYNRRVTDLFLNEGALPIDRLVNVNLV